MTVSQVDNANKIDERFQALGIIGKWDRRGEAGEKKKKEKKEKTTLFT